MLTDALFVSLERSIFKCSVGFSFRGRDVLAVCRGVSICRKASRKCAFSLEGNATGFILKI